MHDLTRLPVSSTTASLATLARSSSEHPPITWFPVGAGLWTGQVGTDYAGIVELERGRYTATDGRGRRVGAFDTRDEAQRHLAALATVAGSDQAA